MESERATVSVRMTATVEKYDADGNHVGTASETVVQEVPVEQAIALGLLPREEEG